MELINNFVITLVTTLILITAVELIVPDNSMKKYVKFVMGIILIAVLLSPIINFFTNGETAITNVIYTYSKDIEKGTTENKKGKENNELLQENFKKNYDKNCVSTLEKEFKNYNFKSDVTCKVDFTNTTVEVTGLKVYIQEKGIKKVEKVEIKGDEAKISEEDNTQREIKSFLSKELEVDENVIQVYYEN